MVNGERTGKLFRLHNLIVSRNNVGVRSIYHLRSTIHRMSRLTKKSLNTYIEIPLAGRSSNGRTADSESAYRGSNPCLPAKQFQ